MSKKKTIRISKKDLQKLLADNERMEKEIAELQSKILIQSEKTGFDRWAEEKMKSPLFRKEYEKSLDEIKEYDEARSINTDIYGLNTTIFD
jgi:hypothetical protein